MKELLVIVAIKVQFKELDISVLNAKILIFAKNALKY